MRLLDVLDLTNMPDFPDARCAIPIMDPDWWHPDPRATAEHSKAACRRCVHQTECLTWALEHDEVGVWGATTTEERAGLRAGVA